MSCHFLGLLTLWEGPEGPLRRQCFSLCALHRHSYHTIYSKVLIPDRSLAQLCLHLFNVRLSGVIKSSKNHNITWCVGRIDILLDLSRLTTCKDNLRYSLPWLQTSVRCYLICSPGFMFTFRCCIAPPSAHLSNCLFSFKLPLVLSPHWVQFTQISKVYNNSGQLIIARRTSGHMFRIRDYHG